MTCVKRNSKGNLKRISPRSYSFTRRLGTTRSSNEVGWSRGFPFGRSSVQHTMRVYIVHPLETLSNPNVILLYEDIDFTNKEHGQKKIFFPSKSRPFGSIKTRGKLYVQLPRVKYGKMYQGTVAARINSLTAQGKWSKIEVWLHDWYLRSNPTSFYPLSKKHSKRLKGVD